jgi:hypothetical protein
LRICGTDQRCEEHRACPDGNSSHVVSLPLIFLFVHSYNRTTSGEGRQTVMDRGQIAGRPVRGNP